MRRTAPQPLLPASIRPLAVALAGFCAALTVLLAAWYAGQTRAGRLDSSVDGRVQDLIGPHQTVLYLVNLGNLPAVTIMSVALFVACLATRRGRGAVLVAVAVPAATALTEVLKHLVDRTLTGFLSFPSGHTTSIFAVIVALAVLLIDPPRRRISAVVRVAVAPIAFRAGSRSPSASWPCAGTTPPTRWRERQSAPRSCW